MHTCPNCGKQLTEEEKICSNCGVNTEEQNLELEDVNNSNEPYRPKRFVSKMNFGPKLFSDDDEFVLLNEYIGKNISKMKNGFSWNTFFFSVYYMFYRKMWLLGFITMIVYAVLEYLIPNPLILLLVALIYDIIISSSFKDLYLKKALITIDNIKAKNPDATDEELAPIVRKKGGTCGWIVILLLVGPIVYAAINFAVVYATLSATSNTVIDLLKERLEESKKSADGIDDMIREKKETNVVGNLYVIFPLGYEQVDADGDTYVFKNKNNCTVTIIAEDSAIYGDDVDTFLDRIIKGATEDENISINNAKYYDHMWRYTRIDKPQQVIYATKYGDKIYEVNISSDEENASCILNAEVLAASFKFK